MQRRTPRQLTAALALLAGTGMSATGTAGTLTITDGTNTITECALNDLQVTPPDAVADAPDCASGGGGGDAALYADNDSGGDVNAGTSKEIEVLVGDTLGAYPNTVKIASQPSKGSTLVLSDNKVRYTADSGVEGSDSFAYYIQDVNGTQSNNATVTMNVVASSEPPPPSGDCVAGSTYDGHTVRCLELPEAAVGQSVATYPTLRSGDVHSFHFTVGPNNYLEGKISLATYPPAPYYNKDMAISQTPGKVTSDTALCSFTDKTETTTNYQVTTSADAWDCPLTEGDWYFNIRLTDGPGDDYILTHTRER